MEGKGEVELVDLAGVTRQCIHVEREEGKRNLTSFYNL